MGKNNIQSGPRPRAQRAVIYGPEGSGKSTLASHITGGVFLDFEQGTDHLNVDRIPINSAAELLAELKWAESGDHSYRSIIIDTGDRMESVIIAELCKKRGWDDLSTPGYGDGYVALEDEFQQILCKMDKVMAAGLDVVVLAHSRVVKMTEPGAAGSYDRYELDLEKRTAPLLKGWADVVLFMNYKTQVAEMEKGSGKMRGVGGKRRIVYSERCAAFDAKCRRFTPPVPAEVEVGRDGMPSDLATIFGGGCAKSTDRAPEGEKGEKGVKGVKITAEDTKEITKATVWNDIIENAGGTVEVELFLNSKGQSFPPSEEYMERILGAPRKFINAVTARSGSAKEGASK